MLPALVLASICVRGAAAQDLRVMSFNIRYATANDGPDAWPNRRAQLVELIRREAPDVIGMQEALYLQLGEIRAQLPVYGGIGVGRDDGVLSGEFSPILYRTDRFDIVNSGTFWFSDTPEVPGSTSWGNTITRICTWAWLREIATGRRFFIYNVHLDHLSQPSRERSVALLLEWIASRSDTTVPVIVTGDFNAGEDNPAVRAMLARFVDTYRVLHPADSIVGTFHAFRGDSSGAKIDYVFVEPATVVRRAAILRDRENGRYPSDHFPVVAELLLLPRSPDLAAAGGGEMAGIVVSATRNDRRVEDQPMRVEVVEPEEVAEKVAMTPGDVAMLLNETGGLRVQNTGPAVGSANVRIHGLRGRYTQLLADGLPLYGEAGAIGLLQIPPMDLLQVEIVKGAASALYGPSALGGLINLVSRRPVRRESELLLNATTQRGGDAVFFGARPLGGPWGGTLLLGGHGQTRFDRDADGWADLPGYERLLMRPRLFYDNHDGRMLFVTAGVTAERRRGGTLDGRVAPDNAPYQVSQRTRRFDAGLSAVTPLGRGLTLKGRASGMLAMHRHAYGDSIDDDRHLSGLAEVTLGRPSERSAWLLGAALPVERFRSDSVARLGYTFTAPALFGQVDLSPSARIAIQASGRVDFHSEYGTQASPRLSALWRAAGDWSVRVSGGLGYFAPTPFVEEVDAVGLRSITVAPLRAERATMLSADIGGLVGPVEINATVFASSIAHPVQLDQIGPDSLELANAGQSVRSQGFDLVARLVREPWHVVAAWTFVYATEAACSTCATRREVSLNPRHSAGLVAAFEQRGWRVGGELYVTGRQALDGNPYRAKSPTYAVVGLLVQRDIGRARLFVNFENLGDARMTRRDPLLLPVFSSRTGWTTDAWGPLEGRVVNGGMRLAL